MLDKLDWRKIIDTELEELKALDSMCFEYHDIDYLREIEPDKGELYRLYSHTEKAIIGYSVYGQFFDNGWGGNAYIMRIGTHPEHRRKGYADWIISAILEDLYTREKFCPAVYCDIRQSNQASMNLFTKNGFKLAQVRDEIYDDGELANCMFYEFIRS